VTEYRSLTTSGRGHAGICGDRTVQGARVEGSALHGAEGQAAHEVALDQHAKHDRGHQRGHGERARLAVLRCLEAEERSEGGRQCERAEAGQVEREKELGPNEGVSEHGGDDDAGHGRQAAVRSGAAKVLTHMAAVGYDLALGGLAGRRSPGQCR
jgi:hypothetical protein